VRVRRRRIGIVGGAIFSLATSSIPTFACQPASPPSCEASESQEICLKRAEQWYAEQEAARIAYEKKTPEERTLIEQARLWDDHEIIFLARIERIKLKGKIYPQLAPKARKPIAGKKPPLPPQIPPVVFPQFGESYSAYIRPVRSIKGPAAFTASWQDVGGMTSCGPYRDGSLSYSYPGDEIVIFANWATTSHMVRGKWVSSEFLSFYGVDQDEVVEPRIKAALTREQRAN
jgi:hypothetical protein